ncbi:MAG: hypothetical protein J7J70_01685 [Deltaproteobacteria bacterium]|nr:hypothetical protein [Candidatus Tharpellaceae bacterium]
MSKYDTNQTILDHIIMGLNFLTYIVRDRDTLQDVRAWLIADLAAKRITWMVIRGGRLVVWLCDLKTCTLTST